MWTETFTDGRHTREGGGGHGRDMAVSQGLVAAPQAGKRQEGDSARAQGSTALPMPRPPTSSLWNRDRVRAGGLKPPASGAWRGQLRKPRRTTPGSAPASSGHPPYKTLGAPRGSRVVHEALLQFTLLVPENCVRWKSSGPRQAQEGETEVGQPLAPLPSPLEGIIKEIISRGHMGGLPSTEGLLDLF